MTFWRDDLWRGAVVRAKRGVYKITSTIFRFHENENYLKNIVDYCGGQNHKL